MSELPVRRPAVAGQFYPSDPDVLRRKIREYVDKATLPADLGAVRAIIAPHAGYIYSGPTAGYAFKALTALPEKQWTVFLLGPAHQAPIGGVALGNYSAFRTPLGDAPIAVDRVAEMLARSSLYTRAPQAHAPEHCLEVEAPFLQMTLSDFRLAPMLFGQVDHHEVAADLAEHTGEDDPATGSDLPGGAAGRRRDGSAERRGLWQCAGGDADGHRSSQGLEAPSAGLLQLWRHGGRQVPGRGLRCGRVHQLTS